MKKKPISDDIHQNKFNIWDFSSASDVEKPFAPTSKMRIACEHRPEMAATLFRNEILDVAQSFASTSTSAYHGKKADITKRLPPYTLQYLRNGNERNTVIIIEMSPLIRAKCSSVTSDVSTFSDLVVVIFYHVQHISSSFDRVDLVFDRYFERSLKEDKEGPWNRIEVYFQWKHKIT